MQGWGNDYLPIYIYIFIIPTCCYVIYIYIYKVTFDILYSGNNLVRYLYAISCNSKYHVTYCSWYQIIIYIYNIIYIIYIYGNLCVYAPVAV